jgi:hypothetical protein
MINLLQHGAVTTLILDVLMFAGVLTLLIGLIALARYRRVIVRWMKAAAEAGATDRPVTTVPRAHLAQEQSAIPLLSIDAAKRPSRASPFRSEAIVGAARASRRAASVYMVAGLAVTSVSAALGLHLTGTEITWLRMIGGVLSYAWPVVLTLALPIKSSPSRRRSGPFAEVDNRPDPDGRYRVNEFFCGNDAWRPAVTRLMAESDLVAMDLRGFSAANQGCVFELQSLIDIVPVARVVLLTDKGTDAPFLRQTLAECWQRMEAASPNRQATGALALLETGGRDVAAVATLMRIADGVLAPQGAALVPAAATASAAAQ